MSLIMDFIVNNYHFLLKNISLNQENSFNHHNFFLHFKDNPKDGVHLSRRPDVLITSSSTQGLYRFGLLVCKVERLD